MTNKHTKRALFSSVLALILCCAMLVGTTFAWFTDSVQSGNNQIVAGNLDVELYRGATKDKVDANTKLFDGIKLWEPGVVAYENLTVANVGNLALKYDLFINVADENATNDGYKLSQVLQVALIEGGVTGTTREAVLAEAAQANPVALETFNKSGELYPTGNADGKSESQVYGLVIFWNPNDNEIDNRYNLKNGRNTPNSYPTTDGKPLHIDLDVKLLATQLPYEEDSFGPDYDADAWYELQQDDSGAYLLYSAGDLMAFNAKMNEPGFIGEGNPISTYVKLMADIDMSGYDWLSINEMFVSFDGNGHTISNLNCIENGHKSGFFAYLGGGIIKNLTLENVTSVGSQAGIFAGQSEGGTISNCNVAGTNYVAWDDDSGDRVTKNGIGVYVGVSVDAKEISGTIKKGAEITLNSNGMTGGWDVVDKYAGGLYNQPKLINVVDENEEGAINELTTVSDGLQTDTNGNYYVSNANGLMSLKEWMDSNSNKGAFWGKSYNLMADIDATGMTWTTKFITPDSSTFDGFTFNGNGFTISNLTIEGQGFFSGATQGSKSTVPTVFEKLTLDNVTVKGATHHVGTVWGAAYGDLTVDEVNVINSTITGGCNVGGIVGRNDEGTATIKFIDCSVVGTKITANEVGDYAGASEFLGMALRVGESTNIKLIFEGKNTAEGNTLSSIDGLQGGGIYAKATWGDATWYTPVVVKTFENYDSENQVTVLVTPENISTQKFDADGATYCFKGEFNDAVALTIPAGLTGVVLDGTDATFNNHVKLTFNRVADGFNFLSETRTGSYTVRKFTVNDSMSVGSCAVQALTLENCKAEAMDFNASNTAITLKGNEIVRGDADPYTRYDNNTNKYALYFYADNYALEMTGNVITDSLTDENLVCISGNYEQYQQNKDTNWTNTISMTNNTLTGKGYLVKLLNDVTYAPVAWPEDYEITEAAQTLAHQLFGKNTTTTDTAVIRIHCRAANKADLQATELNNDVLKAIAAQYQP